MLIGMYEQMCDLVDPGAERPRKRVMHAIQRLRNQRITALAALLLQHPELRRWPCAPQKSPNAFRIQGFCDLNANKNRECGDWIYLERFTLDRLTQYLTAVASAGAKTHCGSFRPILTQSLLRYALPMTGRAGGRPYAGFVTRAAGRSSAVVFRKRAGCWS